MKYPRHILPLAALCLILNIAAAGAQTRAGLLVAQSASDDYRQGERLSMELGISFDTKQEFKIDTMPLSIDFQFAVGIMYENLKEDGYEFARTTDNKLFGEGVLRYPLGWTLDPFVSASFSTNVTETFTVLKGKPQAISGIWDPVVSQQAIGLAYCMKKGSDNFISRIGVSLKQTRADKYPRLTDDRTTPDIIEKYKPESGIQWKTNLDLQLDSLVKYRGSIDFFGTFQEPEIWTMNWQNEFQIKLYKFLAVIFKAGLFYDDNQAPRLQYKQSFRFGIVAEI